MSLSDRLECRGCGLSVVPLEWCWANSMSCPLGFMPRHLNPQDLLRKIWELEHRITSLEDSRDRGESRDVTTESTET